MDKLNNCFINLTETEQYEVDGGLIGIICAIVGTAIAAGTAVYGYGYAKGQQAGYREKYGK